MVMYDNELKTKKKKFKPRILNQSTTYSFVFFYIFYSFYSQLKMTSERPNHGDFLELNI